MSVWLYSVMGFPGKAEEGRVGEQCQYFGISLELKPRVWTKLEHKYDRPWFKDYVQRGGSALPLAIARRAEHEIHVDTDLADMIVLKYGGCGLVRMDVDDPMSKDHYATRTKLEAEAEAAYHRYFEYVVARFEDERKMRQLSKQGRMEPTVFERHCYKTLGLPEPGTLDALKAERSPEVKVELPPEIYDLIREGLAARRTAVPEAVVSPKTEEPAKK